LVPSLGCHPVRVLLVEDEDNMADLVQVMLAPDARLEVIGRARHGGEAVSMARSLDPDVILMDVRMPVMDGVEATRLLRAAGSNARIVVLTGVDEAGRIAEVRAAGADAFVRKIPTAEELTTVILAARREEPG
jgi:DNA-binding NarL/FixJ family response regulator